MRFVLVLDRVMPSTNVTHDDLCGAGQLEIHAEAKVVDDIAPAVTERVAAKNVETRKIGLNTIVVDVKSDVCRVVEDVYRRGTTSLTVPYGPRR